MPVICASNKTHLTSFSANQHVWPLYLTIGDIQKDILNTPTKRTWILVRLISCPPIGARNIDEAWHSTVGTVLSQLRHLDITGPSLKWDCADGFQQQNLPRLAAWVRDYSEQVMVAQVSNGVCPMCEIQKGAPMGHSTFDHSITQDTSIFTQSSCRTILLMLCTLKVSTQSATSSGNTLSAITICFGSLMNCISCSWV